jgi:nitrogen fixation protein NifX
MITAAFATVDGVRVDSHFGWCARFDIYDITAASARLRETRTVPSSADDVDNKDRGHDDHRLQARLDALDGCALVCVASIGPGAAARVVRARVHPLKANPGTTVVSVLDRLQTVLMGTPPPWLRKLQMPHPDHPADSSAGGSP